MSNSNMQAFYASLVEASGEIEAAGVGRYPCGATAVFADLSYQQALLRLTQITVTELRAIQNEMAWQPWWEDAG